MLPRVFLLTLAALAFTGPLEATIILPATLGELTAEADAIVHARVASVTSRQPAGTLRVERVVSLDVVRYLKGSGEQTIALQVPGGTYGRYRTVMPGAPELAPGDEAVFFLRASARGLGLAGLAQGVYRIAVEEASGRRVVRAPFDGTSDGPIRRGDAARRPVSLDEFEGRVAVSVIAARARRSAAR
jgi:hypothetical protein